MRNYKFRSAVMVIFMLSLFGWTQALVAQEKFPSRPIDFMVPWGTGGMADHMSRTLADHMRSILGVAVPVFNVPGASGNVGMQQLVRGRANGYMIALMVVEQASTIPMGMSNFTVDDFEWIARVHMADSFFFVKSDSPYKTIQDVLEAAKKNPGKIRVAITGYGTTDHIAVLFFEKKGFKMTAVPFPSPAERYAAILGGHAEVLYEQAGDMLQFIKAGQVRPVIIFSAERHPAFPDVPATGELGYDIQLPHFRGIVAKKGVPVDRVRVLAQAIQKSTETSSWKQLNEEAFIRPGSYMGPQQFGPWVREQMDIISRYIKQLGLKPGSVN